MLKYFMAIWNILQTFGMFYDHFVHFVFILYVHFSGFGIMHQEKSGNPASHADGHRSNSCQQGDEMSLWKSRPKCSPNHFFVKINTLHTYYYIQREQSAQNLAYLHL
jgi:hypothetical protein